MSILIKGMEMPTSCYECPFLDYEEGFCFASGVKHESGWYESKLCPGGIEDGRHDDCPLIEIPPHGDLIDRDIVYNFAEALDDNKLLAVSGMAFAFLKAKIKDMPTVIEAEGRE